MRGSRRWLAARPLSRATSAASAKLVKTAEAGRIVERNPEAIAAAIKDLLANPPSREAVAAQCQRTFHGTKTHGNWPRFSATIRRI